MADSEPQDANNRPLFLQPWPGYWRTKAKVARLTRFRDLIVHRERWAGEVDVAPPLSEIFLGEDLKPDSFAAVQRINQEIKQNMPMVYLDLNDMGIRTVVNHEEYDDSIEKYDLIADYYRLPRDRDGHAAYQAVIDVLEQGIGLYTARLKQAKLELFNPITWAAHVIRIPVTVMERAGFGANEKTQNMMLGWYSRFLQIMMAIIVGLFMVRQGIKFPWKEVLNWALNK